MFIFFLVLIIAAALVAAFFYVLKIISSPPKGRALDYLSRNVNSYKKINTCIGGSLTHGNIGQNWVNYLPFFYVLKIFSSPPKERALDYLSRNVDSDKKIIACIGDSLTHGNIGQNWVDYLRQEFPNDIFLNEGINGNTAWQVIQRLDPILQCQPDLIILLIGTNDALGSFDINSGLRYKKNNELPEVPTLKKYKEHLNVLIDKIGIQSKIAICTLPPIGENVNSEVNKHVNLFNDYIKLIANQKNLILLPVSDALWLEIQSRTYPLKLEYNPKARLIIRRIFGGIFHHYLFKKSWNNISRAKGQWILFDQIHLNERGAEIVYKLAKDFIAKS